MCPEAPPPIVNGRLAALQRLRAGALPWGVRMGGLLRAPAPVPARLAGPRPPKLQGVRQV